ncbi:MAG: pyridoxamine 5'-phosphate oxidase family protein [Actinomycetota bacterium]
MELLDTTEALESCVGTRPSGSHLKSISFLDEHCLTLLAASPFGVVGVADDAGSLRTFGVGGGPGVFAATGPTRLVLPAHDDLADADGAPIGVLAFVPGYRETLRVNGRLRTGQNAELEVEETFLHCAKALIRSKLWAEPAPDLPDTVPDGPIGLDDPATRAFFEACPLVVLSSVDADGFADVSPKGDPPGMVAQVIDDHTVAIADRPGNRRTDTMHNLVTHDAIGLLAVIPGHDQVIELRGRAGVTSDDGVRERLAVGGKVPHAAIVLSVDRVEARTERGITDAGLWDRSRHIDPADLPRPTQVWTDHVKRNDDPGIGAKIARRVVREKMLDRGIAKDYRDNLY